MNWIKRLFSRKQTTEQCDIHVVVSSTCECGRQKTCGLRSGLCPITGVWHTQYYLQRFSDICSFNTKFNKMEEDKKLEEKSENSNEKLHISDVSCSYIDSLGDIALTEREKKRKWAERNGLE